VAERDGDLEKAAELRYGTLRTLEGSLAEQQESLEKLQANLRMLKEEVDEEDVAEVVARWTGIPVSRLMEGEVEKLVRLEEHLHRRVVGQDEAVNAVANAIGADTMKVSREDIFLALAKEVPGDAEGELIENPHQTWADVNPELPAVKIEVLGPPPTSGTRDAFVELAMEGGCKEFDWIAAMKKSEESEYKRVCYTMREDGGFVEAGENDNLIVQKLIANPDALGIFGFSFLDQNTDKIQGSAVDGVKPSFETIADGSYPVSRPLFFYVKKAHVDVIPGLGEYLAEFTSEAAWGDEGYLSDRGLIPMPKEERTKFAEDAKNRSPMKM